MPTEDMEDDDELRALRDTWAPVDNDTRILTLEFMKGGDMHNLIKKLAKRQEAVPQAVLWRIFFCREFFFSSFRSPARRPPLLGGTRIVDGGFSMGD